MLRKLFYVLIMHITLFLQAQEKTISGVVSDISGPLPGVTVLVKGTNVGTETDFDGRYQIKATVGDVLVFSFIGMKTTENKISSSLVINVLMKEELHQLDEVVVSGYGMVKKAYVTASSSIVSEETYKTRKSKYENNIESGQLTAAEINDVEKWIDWRGLLKNKDFLKVKKEWDFIIGDKIEVNVNDVSKNPVINATVALYNKNKLIQKVKTDVFGKAILYRIEDKSYIIQVEYKNKIKGLKTPINYKQATFIFKESEKLCDIDIMFTIDATGSMGDEISYLKSEIENIITRVNNSIKKKRIGLTFYKDKGDDYIVKDFDFTTDIIKVRKNLSDQYANGGGDYEEAVEEALKVSLAKSWNLEAKSRLLFLLLDAPPHLNKKNIKTLKEQISLAKERGIKIIPIVASGANKTVEYLMRYFSVITNGTYIFLTDDSGIGNSHLKPTTDNFKVEKLNDLIVRVIEKYAGV